jgi:hypothetical protein
MDRCHPEGHDYSLSFGPKLVQQEFNSRSRIGAGLARQSQGGRDRRDEMLGVDPAWRSSRFCGAARPARILSTTPWRKDPEFDREGEAPSEPAPSRSSEGASPSRIPPHIFMGRYLAPNGAANCSLAASAPGPDRIAPPSSLFFHRLFRSPRSGRQDRLLELRLPKHGGCPRDRQRVAPFRGSSPTNGGDLS